MVSDKQLEEFVRRIREAAGANLESVILYGSAVAGDFHPEFSNLNLFCVLRDSSFRGLQALAPVAQWWDGQKQPPPLFMTRRELESSTDIFTIELLDMQRHHRVLFGEDVLQGLQISLHRHHVQVEYELREKLVLLRQQLLLASNNKRRLWDLLVRSVSSFVTLFRHALMVLGQSAPMGKRDTVQAVAAHLKLDASAIHEVMDVREHKASPKKMEVNDLFARYLTVVEQVTDAVDQALGEDASARS
jgi:nucleotidyltransferase-like protein